MTIHFIIIDVCKDNDYDIAHINILIGLSKFKFKVAVVKSVNSDVPILPTTAVAGERERGVYLIDLLISHLHVQWNLR